MGRRSIHTPDELRELIIQATTEIVEHDGLEGLSAREIAKRVGYSPGTLYNVFENLDDLLLTIEARLLDRLAERLAEHGRVRARRSSGCAGSSETYFVFTQERPKLWNLLIEHRMPAGPRSARAGTRRSSRACCMPLEEALAPLLDRRRSRSAEARTRARCGRACTE